MAIAFANTFYNDIMDTLINIINVEFSIPVYLDEARGSHCFVLTPDSDDLIDYMSTGVQREFNVNILYQIKQGGSYTKDVFKQVSNNVERLKRLIFNNSSYNNGSTWFDAKITTVNYERDEDDNSIFKANINFNCQNIEVI